MQPGPFNAKNQKFYDNIADIVSKINVDREQAKIDDSPISELKLPKNPRNRKIKAALSRGADKALDKVTKHGDDVYTKLNKGDHAGAADSEARSGAALSRYNKRSKAANEDIEVEEGKLVDRIMKKRKELKNKGTIPGSDGY
jgi:hypothetical protein